VSPFSRNPHSTGYLNVLYTSHIVSSMYAYLTDIRPKTPMCAQKLAVLKMKLCLVVDRYIKCKTYDVSKESRSKAGATSWLNLTFVSSYEKKSKKKATSLQVNFLLSWILFRPCNPSKISQIMPRPH